MANTANFLEATSQVAGAVSGFVFKPFPANPLVGVSSGDTMSEWSPSYAPRYPHNNVIASPCGHLLEFDSTPGAERVHLYHRTGTHVEMRPDGGLKIKSAKGRQDMTIGDHEIAIKGECKITVEGGSAKIFVKGGSLEVQCEDGAAFNVKGQLKLHADEITMRAKEKISLQSPLIDIGDGLMPYLSLPVGITSLMGVIMPMASGLVAPPVANIPIPKKPSGISGAAVSIGQLATVFTAVGQIATALNTFGSYKNSATMGLSLLKQAAQARGGQPIIPEIKQPEELPLANPLLYQPTTPAKAQLRDRQFDSPDDVEDTTTYIAHLQLMDTLKDITKDHKVLPGQPDPAYVFTRSPAAEPEYPVGFFLEQGTVSCVNGSPRVTGNGTKFTEEIAVGHVVDINTRTFKVLAIESDTAMILDDPWDRADVSGARLSIRMLRPFAEFFNKNNFTTTTTLGNSGLTVGDLMVNYIPPTIEPIPAILQTAKPNTLAANGADIGTTSPSSLGATFTEGNRDSQFLLPSDLRE